VRGHFFRRFALDAARWSRYRKLLLCLGVTAQLSGCVSVDTLVSQNSIRVGMTKTEVANVVLWQGKETLRTMLGSANVFMNTLEKVVARFCLDQGETNFWSSVVHIASQAVVSERVTLL